MHLTMDSKKYIKQKLRELKGKIHNLTIIVEDFNTPFLVMAEISNTDNLDNTLNQLDLIHIDRTLYPTTAKWFFSSTPGSFSRADHILGHEISLNNLKWSIHNGSNKKITRQTRKYFEVKENKNATYQNLWDVARLVRNRGNIYL